MRMFLAAPWPHRGLCWRNQLLRQCCRTISPPNEVTVIVTDSALGFPHPAEPHRCHGSTATVGCWANHRPKTNGRPGSPIFPRPVTHSGGPFYIVMGTPGTRSDGEAGTPRSCDFSFPQGLARASGLVFSLAEKMSGRLPLGGTVQPAYVSRESSHCRGRTRSHRCPRMTYYLAWLSHST